MAVISIKELQALSAADDGRRFSMGESMYGVVRAGADGISVYVKWRYMVAGKRREVSLGTWRDKPEFSLKALRIKRDTLAAEVRQKVDPFNTRAVAKIKRQADAVEALQTQQARLAASEAAQARMSVRELFERWQ